VVPLVLALAGGAGGARLAGKGAVHAAVLLTAAALATALVPQLQLRLSCQRCEGGAGRGRVGEGWNRDLAAERTGTRPGRRRRGASTLTTAEQHSRQEPHAGLRGEEGQSRVKMRRCRCRGAAGPAAVAPRAEQPHACRRLPAAAARARCKRREIRGPRRAASTWRCGAACALLARAARGWYERAARRRGCGCGSLCHLRGAHLASPRPTRWLCLCAAMVPQTPQYTARNVMGSDACGVGAPRPIADPERALVRNRGS
jgi:hypothetical protein